MRFIGESEPLGQTAAFVARHAAGTHTMPALAGLRVTAEDGALRLAGYDYEAGSTATIPVTVTDPGRILLPGRVFSDILRSLPAGPVEVRTVGSKVEILADGIDFGLPTLPLEDYPELPTAPDPIGTVDAESFGRAAARMAKVVLRDDALPMLSGALLEFEPDTLRLAASDRYRIAIAELPWTSAAADVPTSAVVPARLLADTVKGLDTKAELTIGLRADDENVFGVADDSRSTIMRVLDGSYPTLLSKLPTTFRGAFTVDTEELRAAIRRICLVADSYAAVVLSISPGEIVVSAAGDLDTRGRQRLSCELDGDGTTTAFNAGYLLDGLDAVDTVNARIAFDEGIRPALLTSDDDEPTFRYVVQPRRLPVGTVAA